MFGILGTPLLLSSKIGELVDGVIASFTSSIVDGGVTRDREGLVAKVFVFVLLVDNEQTFVAAVALIEGSTSTAVGIMLADAVELRRGDGAAIEETARSSTSNLEVAAASVVDDAGVVSSLIVMDIIYYYDRCCFFLHIFMSACYFLCRYFEFDMRMCQRKQKRKRMQARHVIAFLEGLW